MEKNFNSIIKSAAPAIAIGTTVLVTACSSSVNWGDPAQGIHDLVISLISFASAALGIVFTWVLANLKSWLDAWKKKKLSAVDKAKKDDDNKTKEVK